MKGKLLIKLGIFFMSSSLIVCGAKTTDAALKDFNNDYLLSRIIITNTKESYDDFTDKVSHYKEDISKFYDSLDFYYDQFIEKNKEISSKARAVEDDLKKLENSSFELLNNCKYDIDDEDMNNICELFRTNLNNTISSYEKLVTDYNELINMYNEYAKWKDKKIVDAYESNISDKLSLITRNIND